MSYEKLPEERESWMLVIPRPAEESRVFGPTLLRLHQKGIPVSVLCLCIPGEEDGRSVREQELHDACAVFGISRVRCVDDTCLPYKGQDWNPADVARHVQAAAEEWRATVIVTFDEQSGKYDRLRPFCYWGVAHYIDDCVAKGEVENLPRVKTLVTVAKWTYYDHRASGFYWLRARLSTSHQITHYNVLCPGRFHSAVRKYQADRKWYTGLQDWSRLYAVTNNLKDVTADLCSSAGASSDLVAKKKTA